MRRTVFALFVLLVGLQSQARLSAQSQANAGRATITIDAGAPARPFPHFWEMMGSERAIVTLRQSLRRDIEQVDREAVPVRYLRFHAPFHDEMGVFSEDSSGRPVLNFTYVDQVYDWLIYGDEDEPRKHPIRPFVELSFMPRRLAKEQKTHPFTYAAVVSEPKEWRLWHDLVYKFVDHLVGRYGIDEVSQWYFEVWNEPNLDFWEGNPKQKTYFKLYAEAARAVKEVNPRLRVGGPATAWAGWIPEFIEHCIADDCPLDFVSTHVYGEDDAERVLGKKENVSIRDMVALAVQRVHQQVKESKRPDLPVFWTEFNATYKNRQDMTDSPFMGPWLAHTISRCDGKTAGMSYWAISDVFEEMRVAPKPFCGLFGLVATGHIPKPSFNAFKVLSLLGDERLELPAPNAMATRRKDGTIVLAVWNYQEPGADGPAIAVEVKTKGLAGNHRVLVHTVDENHGSPLRAWWAMGSPDFPTRAQQAQLRKAAMLPLPEERELKEDGILTLNLRAHALCVLEVSK